MSQIYSERNILLNDMGQREPPGRRFEALSRPNAPTQCALPCAGPAVRVHRASVRIPRPGSVRLPAMIPPRDCSLAMGLAPWRESYRTGARESMGGRGEGRGARDEQDKAGSRIHGESSQIDIARNIRLDGMRGGRERHRSTLSPQGAPIQSALQCARITRQLPPRGTGRRRQSARCSC